MSQVDAGGGQLGSVPTTGGAGAEGAGANGIVHVSAKDRATNKEQSITITGQSSLNKDDIERMVGDAEAHAEEDIRRKEEAEVRNNADSLVYQSEKLLKEHGDRISEDEKGKVESSLASLKEALGGQDVSAIRSATESLVTASQGFSQKLYEQASQPQTETGGATSEATVSDDNDVVEAEIVEDDESSTS